MAFAPPRVDGPTHPLLRQARDGASDAPRLCVPSAGHFYSLRRRQRVCYGNHSIPPFEIASNYAIVIFMSEEICPIAEAAKLLGDKWTLIVLRNLGEGSQRFKDLERLGEGVSPSVLTARLKDLEECGMITRTSYNEIPPRVQYDLTEKGRDALPVLEALRVYGTRWLLAAPPEVAHP